MRPEKLTVSGEANARKSVRWLAAEAAFTKMMGLLSAIFVARILGPAAMGILALVALTLAAGRLLSEFGLSQAIIYHRTSNRKQLATLYTYSWLLGIVGYAVTVLASPALAHWFQEPELGHLIPVAGITLLLAPLTQQVNALLERDLRFQPLAVRRMLASAVTLLVAVAGVHMGFGLWAPVAAGLCGAVLNQAFLYVIGRREKLFPGFALRIRGTGRLLAFGAYRSGANALNFVNSRVDRIVVAGALGTASLGLYSMASSWTLETMQQLNSIATRVAFPAIARIQTDLPQVRAQYLRLVNRVTTVNSAFLFGLASIADPLVDWVLGPEWEAMVVPLQLFCAYVLVRSLGNVNGPLVMGLGKANWAFYWNLAATGIIPLTIIGASFFGKIEAVILALLVVQIAFAIVAYRYWVFRLLGPCLAAYTRAIGAPWTSGILMAIIVQVSLHNLKELSSAAQLAAVVPIGTLSYILLTILLNRDAARDLLALLPLAPIRNTIAQAAAYLK